MTVVPSYGGPPEMFSEETQGATHPRMVDQPTGVSLLQDLGLDWTLDTRADQVGNHLGSGPLGAHPNHSVPEQNGSCIRWVVLSLKLLGDGVQFAIVGVVPGEE